MTARQHLDPLWRYHPLTRAAAIEHASRAKKPARLLCPANDKDGHVVDCICQPSDDLVAEVWQGQARMAAARRAAGVSLSALDLQALDRYPDPEMTCRS